MITQPLSSSCPLTVLFGVDRKLFTDLIIASHLTPSHPNFSIFGKQITNPFKAHERERNLLYSINTVKSVLYSSSVSTWCMTETHLTELISLLRWKTLFFFLLRQVNLSISFSY